MGSTWGLTSNHKAYNVVSMFCSLSKVSDCPDFKYVYFKIIMVKETNCIVT